MSRRLAHLLTIAGLLLAVSELQAQTRRALVVGINRYEATAGARTASASPRGTITDLAGAVNDALVVRALLQTRFGFEQANVATLVDREATRAAIISGIERLAAQSQRGDVVVFFYAGHGSQRRNSLSPEASKLDQTLVPADANAGVFDIRDKELARLFNPLVDKGVELVLIFDSCHSGSVARGGLAAPGSRLRERWAAIDPRDAADAGVDQAPEEKPNGAIVISAAQDYQVATERETAPGHAGGIFTSALVATLQSVPRTEPVRDVFKRVKARMQMDGHPQEPVLAGPEDRQRRPLFGGAAVHAGAISAAVLRVASDGQVELQGGPALGIRDGAELRKIGSSPGDTSVLLKVDTVVGVSRVRASVVAGSATQIAPGDLFELKRWVAATNAGLTLALGAPGPDSAALSAVAAQIEKLRGSQSVEWVDDPTSAPADTTPMYVMQWSGAAWELRPRLGAAIALSRTPTAAQVQAALAQRERGKKVRVFLSLPPTRAMATAVQAAVGAESAVRLTSEVAEANYALVGRDGAEGVEYALVQPGGSQATANLSSLPLRTEWIRADNPSIVGRLVDHAFTLARVRSWLHLEGPPRDGTFPYRLAFRRTSDNVLRTEGPFVNGEEYEIVLVADSAQITPNIERRRVYVFAIDNAGNGVLVYPSSNVENRVPHGLGADGRWPTQVPLGPRSRFRVQPPFGTDTFILLASDEPIDTWAFEWTGVTRGDQARGSGLSALLGAASGRTRGIGQETPLNWSIERVSIRSQPRGE